MTSASAGQRRDVTVSARIDAPIDQVWGVLVSPDAPSNVDARVVSSSGNPGSAGWTMVLECRLPWGSRSARIELVEVEEPRRLVALAHGPMKGVISRQTWEVETAAGGTIVRLTAHDEGRRSGLGRQHLVSSIRAIARDLDAGTSVAPRWYANEAMVLAVVSGMLGILALGRRIPETPWLVGGLVVALVLIVWSHDHEYRRAKFWTYLSATMAVWAIVGFLAMAIISTG